jgi:hypothetical protein
MTEVLGELTEKVTVNLGAGFGQVSFGQVNGQFNLIGGENWSWNHTCPSDAGQ